MGRPTKYKTEYCEQATKLCRLGATDEELADFFEVNTDTIYEWQKVHPEFSEALKKGKLLADAEVADKLYQRAIGYIGKTTKFATYEGQISDSMEVEEHYPPDTTAAIFWLKNRQRKKWRDKVETGFTDGDGNDIAQVEIFRLPDNGRSKDNTAAEGLPG
jgi:hypothetical protein